MLVNICNMTFWSLPSPRFWCHPSSRLSGNAAIGSSYSFVLLTAFSCNSVFRMCKLPSPVTAVPPSAPHPGAPRRESRCARCRVGHVLTGSREAEAGQRASQRPSALLRCPCGFASPATLQWAEIAPKHVLPSGERCQGLSSPSALGTALPQGLLLALAPLESPAQHGAGAWSSVSSGKEHLQ